MSILFSSCMVKATAFPIPTGQVSICFWFNVNAWNGSQQNLFGSEVAWRIWIDPVAKKIYNHLFKTTDAAPATTLSLNTWYHYIASADSATGNANSYLNNTLETTDTGHTTAPTTPNSLALGGCADQTLAKCSNAIMEDFRCYNKILSAQERQTIYQGQGHDTILDYTNRWRIMTPGSGLITTAISVYDEIGKKTATLNGLSNGYYSGSILTQRRQTAHA